MLRISFFCVLALGPLLSAQRPQVSAAGETMRIGQVQISGAAAQWKLQLTMEDDNGNRSLPSSYRRWWHVEISKLNPSVATTLDIEILRSGYRDIILPCWSRSRDGGRSFGPYQRTPLSSLPKRSGSTHRFRLLVPKGVSHIRLAKFFPWTFSECEKWIASLQPNKRLRPITTLGSSEQQRPIRLLELSNNAIPDSSKRRVWIHSGIHPGETTSYFVVQGLVEWLLSGRPEPEALLRQLVIDIVPMANPDGVALGNYRTNSRSSNLEIQWARPYTATAKEVVALRSRIEALMGTAANPGPTPIELLLNLHSTHGHRYPMHFRHVSNPGFDVKKNAGGVIPAVHRKETRWIKAFRARSPFVARGIIANSTLSPPSRPYVEAMMHDRWSINRRWLGSPKQRQEVMAITFEGSYGLGPDGKTWSTMDDYRQVGRELGLALIDYFDLKKSGAVLPYGLSCGLKLQGSLLPGTPSRLQLDVQGQPGDPVWLAIGRQKTQLPLPFGACPLQTQLLLFLSPGALGAKGQGRITLSLPPVKTLAFDLQALSLRLGHSSPLLTSSQGLDVLYTR